MQNTEVLKMTDPRLPSEYDLLSVDQLKDISEVWKVVGEYKCKICGGLGHIEVECSTKLLLDSLA